MLKLFHGNMALQAVLIVAVTLLLWVPPLLAPTPMDGGENPAILYGLLCSWMQHTPRLAVIIAIILVIAEGIGLNILLSDIGLVSQSSLLPTLLYIAVASAGAATLTPMIPVCGVAILCLHQLMLRGTLLTITPVKICNATAFIAIASMFYQPAVALMLSYLLVAASYRLYTWKDWMLMILGFAAPYTLLAAVLYMTGGLADWWTATASALGDIRLHVGHADLLPLLGGVCLALALLWSLLTVNLRLGEHPVVWQKNASAVMLLAVGGVAMLFYRPLLPFLPACFALPFTFCTSRFLLEDNTSRSFRNKKHLWAYDLMFILIIIAAIVC